MLREKADLIQFDCLVTFPVLADHDLLARKINDSGVHIIPRAEKLAIIIIIRILQGLVQNTVLVEYSSISTLLIFVCHKVDIPGIGDSDIAAPWLVEELLCEAAGVCDREPAHVIMPERILYLGGDMDVPVRPESYIRRVELIPLAGDLVGVYIFFPFLGFDR